VNPLDLPCSACGAPPGQSCACELEPQESFSSEQLALAYRLGSERAEAASRRAARWDLARRALWVAVGAAAGYALAVLS